MVLSSIVRDGRPRIDAGRLTCTQLLLQPVVQSGPAWWGHALRYVYALCGSREVCLRTSTSRKLGAMAVDEGDTVAGATVRVSLYQQCHVFPTLLTVMPIVGKRPLNGIERRAM